jgi:hypothetical protein
MELLSDPLNGPLGSSPPPTTSLDLGELPTRPTSPSILPEAANTLPTTYFDFEISSDPFDLTAPFSTDTAEPHRLSRIPNRKRDPSSPLSYNQATPKEPRIDTTPQSARDLVLQARDLLI